MKKHGRKPIPYYNRKIPIRVKASYIKEAKDMKLTLEDYIDKLKRHYAMEIDRLEENIHYLQIEIQKLNTEIDILRNKEKIKNEFALP